MASNSLGTDWPYLSKDRRIGLSAGSCAGMLLTIGYLLLCTGRAQTSRLEDDGGMSELSRRVSRVVSGASGNAVSSAVTALCSIAGVAFHDPGLGLAAVPVGALAGSVTEEATDAIASLLQQRRERVQRFADEAETAAGTQMEELIQQAAADARTLEMLARSVEAASRSLDDQKIDLLARIFVNTVHDPAKVDEANILIEALRQIEAPHLRVLAVLAEPGPHLVPGRATEDRPRTPENMARIPAWRIEDILSADPGLSGAFDALIAKLNALGLVYDEGSGRLDYEPLWFLTPFGRACVRYLGERGSGRQY